VDYSLEPVPTSARKGFWPMFFIMLGFTFFSASMSVGAKLGNGLDLNGFIWAILLGGIILGPKLGALSQIVYIILGLVGIPIFAGFSGGLQTILKPSFGFLLGFIFAAYVVGKMLEDNSQLKTLSYQNILLATIVGTLVIYIFGLPYMYFILNNVMNLGLSVGAVIKMGSLLFLPGDILKIIISTFVGVKLIPIVRKNTY